MAFLGSAPPTYAQEQLTNSLTTLATIPVAAPAGLADDTSTPNSSLQAALEELTASRPPNAARLAKLLEALVPAQQDGVRASVSFASDVDRAAEAEVVTRAVSVVWAHVLQVFVDGALHLEDDRTWWEVSLASRSGTVMYLVQSLPQRLYKAISKTMDVGPLSAKLHSFKWPTPVSLFRPLHDVSAATVGERLSSLLSPLALTRREMLSNKRALTAARNAAAHRVGVLATQGPHWNGRAINAAADPTDLNSESNRVYSVLCEVLDVPPPRNNGSLRRSKSSGRRDSDRGSSSRSDDNFAATAATPQSLLTVLTTYLPRAREKLDKPLELYGRPSALTRLWFPFLFAPPALYWGVMAIARNKEWIHDQVSNAKETVRGFFVRWVWEPAEDIFQTMRGGGEGLSVAPETVKADQASLERMVMDLGRDYYHLQGDQLLELQKQVEKGDMEAVLKVYESELQSPIRNILAGQLIRTLLIQVQKTKTDLSLSLLSLDHLLRSQQLTFAFVGVAPSVLLLYGAWGWLSRAYRGENRGKGRRRRYFFGMRDVERILITAPEEDARMSECDRGLIIVSVSGLRAWAAGMRSSSREPFLDDLRMMEDPGLGRVDKLRVVDGMWRCWGVNGAKHSG